MHLMFLDTETTGANPHKASLLGISYAYGEEPSQWTTSVDTFREVWESKGKPPLCLHNAKYDLVILQRHGLDVVDYVGYDTMVAYYLLHIDKSCKMEEALYQYTKTRKKDLLAVYNESTAEDRKSIPDNWYTKVPHERLGVYAKEDIDATRVLYKHTLAELEKNETLKQWFYDVELPVVRQLTLTELKGVQLNVQGVNELEASLTTRRTELERRLRKWAELPDLNLNSPKQLNHVLYEKWELPVYERSKKTQEPSSGVAVLTRLATQHAFPKYLLEFREVDKLIASFTHSLVAQADEAQRIHPTYSQCLTATRRLSCSDPNLQQIPSKTKLGQEIRGCFIPMKGHSFVICDYDQIELRLLAHFSQDVLLKKAFAEGIDIHSLTAEQIGNRLGKVFERRNGKILNFSLVYGKTAFGFAKDWGCSQREAEEALSAYFESYPGVAKYLDEQKYNAKRGKGWVKSLAGLPLFVGDELFSSNKWEVQKSENKAVNYPIQSSSQDIIKRAKVSIHKQLNLVPVLEVHDELVYEVPTDKAETYLSDIQRYMEGAWELTVPLKVSGKVASHWEK